MYKRPAKEVGEHIRGEAGTPIVLGVAKRKCGSGTVYIEQVELIRGEATLPDQRKRPVPKCVWEKQSAKEGETAGIGVLLRPNQSGNLEISQLVPNGPADASGLVDNGDVLHEVDGINILGKPLSEVGPMIRGEPGTTVVLGIAKDGDVEKMVYPVIIRDNSAHLPQKHLTNVAKLAALAAYVSFDQTEAALCKPGLKQRPSPSFPCPVSTTITAATASCANCVTLSPR
mmetsp:Transcript_17673/g.41595  ORF Transcript_17673/g.41595 Transcript_17673/m.41595 type:complete len:229 (-) Transcript_17673:108-794(-)